MRITSFTSEAGVTEVLQRSPGLASVFIRSGTACVGCYLARFCTLRDVIAAYQLDEEKFLGSLSNTAPADFEVSHPLSEGAAL
jgi:hypothetical protein